MSLHGKKKKEPREETKIVIADRPKRRQLKVQKANSTHSKKVNLPIPFAEFIGAEVGDYLTIDTGSFEGKNALILWKTIF